MLSRRPGPFLRRVSRGSEQAHFRQKEQEARRAWGRNVLCKFKEQWDGQRGSEGRWGDSRAGRRGCTSLGLSFGLHSGGWGPRGTSQGWEQKSSEGQAGNGGTGVRITSPEGRANGCVE